MYNVPTLKGYVRFYRVDSLAIKNNICATTKDYNHESGYLIWLYVWNQKNDSVDLQPGDNKFYGLNDINGKNWNIANAKSAWHPDMFTNFKNNPDREISLPFDEFTFKSHSTVYGAQR